MLSILADVYRIATLRRDETPDQRTRRDRERERREAERALFYLGPRQRRDIGYE